jgi:signal transduction histidine kinase
MLVNLVKNAREAIRDNGNKGTITIETKTGKNYNQLIIRDNAIGISKEFLEKMFTPFETKKSTRGGAGLGLLFCKMVMESYHGSITCDSKPGKYTELVLNFPKISR